MTVSLELIFGHTYITEYNDYLSLRIQQCQEFNNEGLGSVRSSLIPD